MKVLPVTVLSGFLGAGKTTIINHLLRHPGGRRFAVLVNDLAEINFDGMRLKAGRTRHHGASAGEPGAGVEFVELHNGCICCTLREEFVREVSRLARTQRFDALLVEATGVAEPLPVAMAFDTADPEGQLLGSLAGIDSMVTVVDAYNFLSDWERAEELSQLGLAVDALDNRTTADLLAEQVEYANQIIINKTDLVPAETVIQLEELLTCLNPEARLVRSMFGTVDPEQFLGTGLFDTGDQASTVPAPSERTAGDFSGPSGKSGDVAPPRPRDLSSTGNELGAADRRTQTPALHDSLGITSFIYRARRPFHPERLWDCLAETWPGVLRSKGLFWLATRMGDSGLWSQAGKACSHQGAGRWWSSLPDHYLPDDEGLRQTILTEFRGPFGDRRQEIVIIGRNLDRKAIRERLDACLLDASEMRLGPMGWRHLADPFPPWETDTEDETEMSVPILRRETPTA